MPRPFRNAQLNRSSDIAPKLSLIAMLFAAVLAGCSPQRALADPKPRELTVASWNLEWFFDEYRGDNRSDLSREQSAPSRRDWEWKRDAVAKAIATLRPDIIALQEVENRKVLQYLCQQIDRAHGIKYRIAFIEGSDVFTEQDVAILYRSGLVRYCRHEQSWEMFRSKRYYNVSKHIAAHFEWGSGDQMQRLAVMNVHLRSRAKGADVRRRQARLVQAWIQPWLAAGEHVIVLGDTNAEQTADDEDPHRTIGILAGRETEGLEDDLIDLHTRLQPDVRRTHLLPGKQFDRMLISPSLAPRNRPAQGTYTLKSFRVMRQLAVRGRPDGPEHWENYYDRPVDERDISDHYPIVATFELVR